MGQIRNILFIMCDQLRWDYLSCAGHPHLATPNVDSLARRGVRFDHAYVQAPVCGPSRMSFYTGRYVVSHRSIWNFVPLPVGELTLGDYLREAGLRVALAGKTHMAADAEGMKRLGLDPSSERGTLVAECGFEPFDRDDGLFPSGFYPRVDSNYANYLRRHGYDSDNPWHDYANSAAGPNGEILSGWYMRHARLPARVAETHSETPYMTDRAIQFIDAQGDRPWCLHLSYIKPHWPYIAPAPYNDMYGPEHMLPVQRDPIERADPHPVYAAFMQHEESVAFRREEVRATVVPTYMGLVKQIDDHLGRLFAHLERAGRMDDTLIVFTSDHGDYLGDHFLGEKELYHDVSARVPLIVVSPDPTHDATRGTVSDALVEAIDVLPTCLEAVGLTPPAHIVEGRSLLPLLAGGTPSDWRTEVFSEFDYSFRERTRERLRRPLHGCRTFMVRDARWKFVFYEGFRPQLFDLKNDPSEFVDRGADPDYQKPCREMADKLFVWLRNRTIRQTAPDAFVSGWTKLSEQKGGVLIGIW